MGWRKHIGRAGPGTSLTVWCQSSKDAKVLQWLYHRGWERHPFVKISSQSRVLETWYSHSEQAVQRIHLCFTMFSRTRTKRRLGRRYVQFIYQCAGREACLRCRREDVKRWVRAEAIPRWKMVSMVDAGYFDVYSHCRVIIELWKSWLELASEIAGDAGCRGGGFCGSYESYALVSQNKVSKVIRHQELRCDKASLSRLGFDCTRFTQTGCVLSKSLLKERANGGQLGVFGERPCCVARYSWSSTSSTRRHLASFHPRSCKFGILHVSQVGSSYS